MYVRSILECVPIVCGRLTSWHHLTKLLAGLQNPSTDLVRKTFQNASDIVNANQWIYTDGSKTDGATSAAIFVDKDSSVLRKLRTPATVFDAELTAILMAVEYIEKAQTSTI